MKRPPLPTETLREINLRRKDDPEVVALLWEIHRLRHIAKMANALARSAPRFDDTYRMLADQMVRLTENEPVVIEHQATIAELTEKPPKKRI